MMRATLKYFRDPSGTKEHEAYPTAAVEHKPPDDGSEPSAGEEPDVLGAAAIQFPEQVAPHVRTALRRLHQNLGHPRNEDLVRHIRLGGAKEYIAACKGMTCSTCLRSTAAAIP
eukprot:11496686-Alexandrium_andersonii.AAC.1